MPAEKSRIPLICEFPGCKKAKIFYRPSEFKFVSLTLSLASSRYPSSLTPLRKHTDRHIRPYKCEYPNCTAPAFGDAGGLFRHKREVHRRGNSTSETDANNGKDGGITEFFCPEPSCLRSQKGFPRRWNLMEHQKRVHHIVVPDRGEMKRAKRAASVLSPTTGQAAAYATPMDVEAVVVERRPPTGPSGNVNLFVGGDVPQALQATLRKLQRQRDELQEATSKLDRDIDVVKQAMVVHVQVGGE
jgi:hypothetical protein